MFGQAILCAGNPITIVGNQAARMYVSKQTMGHWLYDSESYGPSRQHRWGQARRWIQQMVLPTVMQVAQAVQAA